MAITKIEVPELFDFGSDNSAFKLPTGTTADRPTSPSNGEMRFNTTTGYVEYYDTTDAKWWEIDYEALCTTNNPNYPITNLAYYKMSNASDSGEGSGYIGQGGIFNGSSSVISLGTSSPLNTFGGAQTISVWIKPNTSTHQEIIGYRNDSTLQWNYLEKMSNNTIRFLLRKSSTPLLVLNTVGTVTLNQWNHIAVTVDSSSAKIYINNGSAETASNSITSFSNSESTNIGDQDPVQGVNYFNGTIDQVRIYNTALSSSNVSLLYAETSATSSTLDYPVTATALYEFSGNANDTGNTYNGTATNVEYAYNGTASNVNFNVAGKFGNAGEFNGSTSVINTNLIPNYQNFTMSLWLKIPSGHGTGKRIISNVPAGTVPSPAISIIYGYLASDDLVIQFYDGAVNHNVVKDNIPSDTWFNLTFTWESGGLFTGYYNGNFIDSSSIPTFSNSSVTPIYFGYYPRINTYDYSGSIDQVRIFSSALDASQVTQLYEEIQCVPTIVPSENFNTVLYTGNGGTQAITGVGFEPNLTWIKQRNGTGRNVLTDSVRGVTKYLFSELTNAEVIYGSNIGLTSFDSNGFTVADPGALNYSVNGTSKTYVAWNWKAGGAAVSNTDGTITSQVSANVDAGFSIVKYTGNSTAGATVGHGLSEVPEMIIVKITSGSIGNWAIFHKDVGATKFLMFTTNEAQTNSAWWNNTAPSSSVFSLGTISDTNTNTSEYIAYAFHSVDGFSKIGSYVGTGVSNNNTIVTGFRPAFIMIKRTNTAGYDWNMFDNKRDTTNPNEKFLEANTNDIEATGRGVNFLSNGFELFGTSQSVNGSGGEYIFMAFAADPT